MMNDMIKPHTLKNGDRVAIIAPASAASLDAVDKAEQKMKAIGLDPVMFPTCYTRYGHLAASDEARARDLNQAFADQTIAGIICLRGGYGALRILPMIDYEMIKKNPKVFVGFSDITAIHIAINKICRMVTYHGPMAISPIVKIDEDKIEFEKYTYKSFKKNIFSTDVVGLYANPEGQIMGSLSGGRAEGEIIGGNLSLLVATLGSPYELDVRDKILFIEDIGEAVYRIDRMLTSLSLAGKFNDCKGIILGTWEDCVREKKCYENGLDLPLEEVFQNTIVPFNKPIITNFKVGHNYPQATMAFGTNVIMDADKKQIIFTESGNI